MLKTHHESYEAENQPHGSYERISFTPSNIIHIENGEHVTDANVEGLEASSFYSSSALGGKTLNMASNESPLFPASNTKSGVALTQESVQPHIESSKSDKVGTASLRLTMDDLFDSIFTFSNSLGVFETKSTGGPAIGNQAPPSRLQRAENNVNSAVQSQSPIREGFNLDQVMLSVQQADPFVVSHPSLSDVTELPNAMSYFEGSMDDLAAVLGLEEL
jgi:hypothetical protein